MIADSAVEYDAGRSRFYVSMAGVCALIAFGLFAPTYWLQIPAGTFTGSPLLHLHGLLFSAWTLFFLAQTVVAKKGRIETHRAMGLFGIALATAMVFSGFATAIKAMINGISAGHVENARAFAIVPISAIVTFGAFVAVAIAKVKKPEIHKRLMLLATITIIQAPLDRIFFALHAGVGPGLRPGALPSPPPQAAVPSGLITIALVLVGVVYDWRTRGRPHPVYLVGGGIIAAAIFLRAPLSDTSAWTATANFLASFAS